LLCDFITNEFRLKSTCIVQAGLELPIQLWTLFLLCSDKIAAVSVSAPWRWTHPWFMRSVLFASVTSFCPEF